MVTSSSVRVIGLKVLTLPSFLVMLGGVIVIGLARIIVVSLK
jgi:hypothetical protein